MGERKRRFGQRVAAVVFRLMDRGRRKQAFEAARQQPTGTDFAEFDGLRLYVRTDASTGKVKRIRRNPRVVLISAWTSVRRPSSNASSTSSSPPAPAA